MACPTIISDSKIGLVDHYAASAPPIASNAARTAQRYCRSHNDPCRLSFIGDYFGLAVSRGNVYVLSVSTHYPSTVIADEGGPVYYQQQVLSTLSRTALGVA